MGLGSIALSSLLKPEALLGATNSRGSLGTSHFPPKAKRIIYLFQSGGPSQLDLYDPKPTLIKKHGTELPEEIRQGQRLTAMSGNQASLPLENSHILILGVSYKPNVKDIQLTPAEEIIKKLIIKNTGQKTIRIGS